MADSAWPLGASSGNAVFTCLVVTRKLCRQFSQENMREDTELGPSVIQRNPQTALPHEFNPVGLSFFKNDNYFIVKVEDSQNHS